MGLQRLYAKLSIKQTRTNKSEQFSKDGNVDRRVSMLHLIYHEDRAHHFKAASDDARHHLCTCIGYSSAVCATCSDGRTW